MDLDKLQSMGDNDGKDEDADSQKHILRQTRVNVSNEKNPHDQEGDWEKSQVLGWQKSDFRGRSEASPASRSEPFPRRLDNMV